MENELFIRNGILRKALEPCSGRIEVPSDVTAISSEAFAYKKDLTEIIIPDSVTRIGEKAFYGCSSLARVVLPSSMRALPENVFQDCKSLKSVTLPKEAEEIGSYAFYGCTALENIDLPSSLKKLGFCAFSGCTSLSSIRLGKNLEKIGEVFLGCTSLQSIDVDPENSTLRSVRGIVYDIKDNSVVAVPKGICGEVDLPSFLAYIPESAFSGCERLTSLKMGNGITYVGKNAFNGCSALTKVVLSQDVKTIEPYAFAYCSLLKSIYLPNSVDSIGENAFLGCDSLDIYCEGDVKDGFTDKTETTYSVSYSAEDDAFNFHRSSGSWNGHTSVDERKLHWNPDGRPFHPFTSRKEYADRGE